MEAPPRSSDADAELDELRRRAYGPDADIHTDAAALARLRELEARGATAAPVRVADDAPAQIAGPVGAVTSEPAPAPQPASTAAALAVDAPSARVVADDAAADDAVPVGWWRRTPRWSLVAGGAALGLAAGLAIPWLVAGMPDAALSPIDRAGIDPDFIDQASLGWYGLTDNELIPYETFGGARPWAGVNDEGARCVFIEVDGAWMAGGCTPAGLDPVADLLIYEEGPLVREELPPGSVVRFTQRADGTISVRVAEAAASDDA